MGCRSFRIAVSAAGVLLSVIILSAACRNAEKISSGIARSGDAGRSAAREEVLRRAEQHLTQKRLIVDYYRIHRKLAYPLPVTRIDNPPVPVEDSFSYPWEIWMLWELEERINCLGLAAEWTGAPRFREAAVQDLEALAAWESYNVQREPHLSVGHAARIMSLALGGWDWLPSGLKETLEQACRRLVDQHAAWLQGRLELKSVEQVLAATPPVTHNIPLIASLGMCMAARSCGHPLRDALEQHCLALVLAVLDMRGQELTEAVSYDGYILDFVADWLASAPEESRRAVLNHPQTFRVLGQAALLSAPGCAWRFAPFNDVEPREMPFHADAQAKFLRFQADSLSAWYMRRFPLEILRAEGLAAMDALASQDTGAGYAPSAGAIEALYALVLRTGWEEDDLAVAVSASNATAGHIQFDSGSLVLGTRGRWLIDDPGYQQYLSGDERDFTLGPGAHNYPVLNGLVQNGHGMKRLLCSQESDSLCHARLDLTGCYDRSLKLDLVSRDVWLAGKNLVVVADRVKGRELKEIRYTWQGCAEAAWWPRDGAWLLTAAGADLWIQSPGRPLDGGELYRHPGTRGQMSLRRAMEAGDDNCLWWVFNLDKNPASCSLDSNGLRLRVDGWREVFTLKE